MNLYEKIQLLCNENKISIAELERRAGLVRGVIGHWKDKSPSVDRLAKVASVLDVTIDYLVGLTEANDSSIVSIQRARAKMNDANKKKMDDILRIAFEKEFSDNTNDDDIEPTV